MGSVRAFAHFVAPGKTTGACTRICKGIATLTVSTCRFRLILEVDVRKN